MKTYFYYKLGNQLFKHAYWLYYPVYTKYKKITDRTEFKLLKNFLRKGDCVIDIGANIGIYSRFFSNCVGEKGSVYAFEPDDTNFTHLLNSVKDTTNVFLKNVAISDHCGTVNLYTSDNLNVDHRTYPAENRTKHTTIECVTIDSLFKRQQVRCIKMDIQGYELIALKGMTTTLKENADIFVLMELWPYGLALAGCQLADIEKFFSKLGFSLTLNIDNCFIPYNISLLKTDHFSYYTLLAQKIKK